MLKMKKMGKCSPWQVENNYEPGVLVEAGVTISNSS